MDLSYLTSSRILFQTSLRVPGSIPVVGSSCNVCVRVCPCVCDRGYRRETERGEKVIDIERQTERGERERKTDRSERGGERMRNTQMERGGRAKRREGQRLRQRKTRRDTWKVF